MDRRVILVVDDDVDVPDLLEQTLGNRYQVLAVPHGRRALELAETKRFDLAIVARCLPDTDGLEVLKNLALLCPTVPILFLAVSATKDLILSAFRLGARDFAEKPLSPETLLESLGRLEHGRQPSFPTDLGGPRQGGVEANGSANTIMGFLRASLKRPIRKLLGKEGTEGTHGAEIDEVSGESLDLPSTVQTNTPSNGASKGSDRKSSSPLLRVHFLGGFEASLDDLWVRRWPGRKGKAIFAYLVFYHKRRIVRDVLMDTFWPRSSADAARNCLNVALHGIRRTLSKLNPSCDYILFRDECYFINPEEVEVWVDVEEFLEHWRVAQSIEREKGIHQAIPEYELAAALYKGDFMEEDRYESWPSDERDHLKEIHLLILDKLSQLYCLDGKAATAISLCETILEKDACREDVHRRLMRCYFNLGQRDKALKQFRRCEEILKEELDVEPTAETVELYEEIRRGELETVGQELS